MPKTWRHAGRGRFPPKATARRFGWPTARHSSVRRHARLPNAWACRRIRGSQSTTPSSSGADRPVSPPRSTGPPRDCARWLSSARLPAARREHRQRIENYLGFPNGVSGDELASRALRQAKRLGAEILVTRAIARLDPETRTILLDGGEELHGRTIIIATGVSWRRLDIDGFDRLVGKGIYYGAARSEAGVTQGLDVHLIGAGNSAGQAAMFFANHARSVTLVIRGASLSKSMSQYLIDQIGSKPNIRLSLQSELHAVHGEDHLTAIDYRRPRQRQRAARGLRRAVRLYRRRRGNRLAAAGNCAQCTRLCPDRG